MWGRSERLLWDKTCSMKKGCTIVPDVGYFQLSVQFLPIGTGHWWRNEPCINRRMCRVNGHLEDVILSFSLMCCVFVQHLCQQELLHLLYIVLDGVSQSAWCTFHFLPFSFKPSAFLHPADQWRNWPPGQRYHRPCIKCQIQHKQIIDVHRL